MLWCTAHPALTADCCVALISISLVVVAMVVVVVVVVIVIVVVVVVVVGWVSSLVLLQRHRRVNVPDATAAAKTAAKQAQAVLV